MKKNIILKYYRRDYYGVTRYYLKDPKIEAIISQITGKKTIDPDTLKQFEKLGIRNEFVAA